MSNRTQSWEQMLHTRSRSSVGSRTSDRAQVLWVLRIQSSMCCMILMYYVFIYLSHLKYNYTETSKEKENWLKIENRLKFTPKYCNRLAQKRVSTYRSLISTVNPGIFWSHEQLIYFLFIDLFVYFVSIIGIRKFQTKL